MTGYSGKTTNSPRDVIGGQARAETEAQWGEMTGTVVSFNAEKQTATIQPDYQRRLGGKPAKLPELQEVPVRFPRMGGFVVTAPVKAGDKVSLRPLMRNSEAFHSGEDYVAPDARSNSLSDMEAHLDGGEPLSNPIPNFNGSNIEIRSEDGQFGMEMSEDGKFRMRGSEGNWYDLTASAVELAADGFTKLGTEATLDHMADYAQIGANLTEIAGKLRAMAL